MGGAGGGERVLEGGVLRVELGGDVGFGDAGVVRREVVALEAKRADPDLGGEVDPAKRVEGHHTCLASQRRVWEGGNIWV